MSEEDFEEWKQSVVTLQFFKWLDLEAHLQRSKAALGGCKKTSFVESGEDYIQTMIRAETLEMIKDVQYDDLNEENLNEDIRTERAQGFNKA